MRTPGPEARTVLLVEDEAVIRELAAAMLLHEGYAVLKARNAAEALRFSREYPGSFDLLVTDICMPPQMNGRQMAALLRQERPGLPVLYISGYFDDAEVVRELERGQACFLQKPFSRDALLEKVKATMGHPVAQAEDV